MTTSTRCALQPPCIRRDIGLIEGVTAVTGVHGIDDQNVALRLVALVDRLYDAGIPWWRPAPLDTIFSEKCWPVDITERMPAGHICWP